MNSFAYPTPKSWKLIWICRFPFPPLALFCFFYSLPYGHNLLAKCSFSRGYHPTIKSVSSTTMFFQYPFYHISLHMSEISISLHICVHRPHRSCKLQPRLSLSSFVDMSLLFLLFLLSLFLLYRRTRKRFGISPLAIILFTCSSSENGTLCRGYGDCGWLPRRKEAKQFNFERFCRRSVFNFCLKGFLVRGIPLPGSGIGIGVKTSSRSPTPRFASWSANSASRRRSRERVRRCGSKILCSLFFQEFFLSGEGWRLEENRGSADVYRGRVSCALEELSIV
jgi:hypothetical protein